MGRHPRVAGFIPESFQLPAKIVPMRGNREISTDTAGNFLGLRSAVSSITEPPHVPMAGLGASARNSSGGTKHRRSGLGWTFPISLRRNHPTTGRHKGLKVTRPLLGIVPSSFMRMDWVGYGHQLVYAPQEI